jgi:hypothetical protein
MQLMRNVSLCVDEFCQHATLRPTGEVAALLGSLQERPIRLQPMHLTKGHRKLTGFLGMATQLQYDLASRHEA